MENFLSDKWRTANVTKLAARDWQRKYRENERRRYNTLCDAKSDYSPYPVRKYFFIQSLIIIWNQFWTMISRCSTAIAKEVYRFKYCQFHHPATSTCEKRKLSSNRWITVKFIFVASPMKTSRRQKVCFHATNLGKDSSIDIAFKKTLRNSNNHTKKACEMFLLP